MFLFRCSLHGLANPETAMATPLDDDAEVGGGHDTDEDVYECEFES